MHYRNDFGDGDGVSEFSWLNQINVIYSNDCLLDNQPDKSHCQKVNLRRIAFATPVLVALVLTSSVTAQTFTTLHSFATATVNSPYIINSDGARVLGGLILSGNSLYGTAQQGGSLGYGTLFKVSVDGSGFTNLYFFNGVSDSGCPSARLIISGNTLYGTSVGVGGKGNGSVFSINTNGTNFTNLHIFGGSDGANLSSELILLANTLYGTAAQGGSLGGGTLFGVNTDGLGFTNLHNFSSGSDGTFPNAGVVSSGNTLYGTAENGGASGNGTVFAVNTDGTSFTNLHSFTAFASLTNSDGANPFAGMILVGNTLYGTTVGGGRFGNGSVFALHTDGTGFTNLHSFTAYSGNKNNDGARPNGRLILAGNTLYGTATYGGNGGCGTVFSLSLSLPQLTIIPYGTDIVLTWPADAVGFNLQSTSNLDSSAIWTTNSTVPVIINGQNIITNPIFGTQLFFRLSK